MTRFWTLYLITIVCVILWLSISGLGQNNYKVDVQSAFIASGYMGDIGAINFTDGCTIDPHSGDTCIRIIYYPDLNNTNRRKWAGIYWQYPDSNWGDFLGRNLNGAKNLTFYARGESGGEKAEFKVGGVTTGNHPDSITIPASTGVILLSKDWKQYRINLEGQNLTNVIGGFCWVTNENQNPLGSTIYLDDIRYEW
jgi:hypothetical protein